MLALMNRENDLQRSRISTASLTHSLSHFRFSLCVSCEDTGSCVLNEYCNETLAYTGGRCLCVVLE